MYSDDWERVEKSFAPDRESVAFTRYADKSIAETEEERAIFQQPRGEKLRSDY